MSAAAAGAWSWLSNGSNLQGAGTVIAGLGQAYGAYQQNQIGKDVLKMQEDEYLYARKEDKDRRNGLNTLRLT